MHLAALAATAHTHSRPSPVCATADPLVTPPQPRPQPSLACCTTTYSAQSTPTSPAPQDTSKQTAPGAAAKTRTPQFNLTSSSSAATARTAADLESDRVTLIVDGRAATRTSIEAPRVISHQRRARRRSVAIVARCRARPQTPSSQRAAAVKGAAARNQRELLLPKAIDNPKTADGNKKSRPPLSYKPPEGANTADAAAASTSAGRAVIPPSDPSARLARARAARSTCPPAAHLPDSYRDEPAGASQRDRHIAGPPGPARRRLFHLAPSESGEMTTTTDNDNTADIFMKIARRTRRGRRRSSQPPREPSVIVTLLFCISFAKV